MAFQMAAIGSIGWMWALLFVSWSPTASSTISRDALKRASIGDSGLLPVILPALILGFIVPSIVMCFPSPTIVSNSFQQWAVVAWNVFPLLVYGFLKIFSGAVSLSRKRDSPNSKVASNSTFTQHLSIIRLANSVALAVGFSIHVLVMGLAICTSLFPVLFDTKYVDSFGFGSLFIPPLSVSQGGTVGDGIRSFFLWDQVGGFSVVIITLTTQLRTALRASGRTFHWFKAIAACAIVSLIAGPGSACILISWLRDEILFEGKL